MCWERLQGTTFLLADPHLELINAYALWGSEAALESSRTKTQFWITQDKFFQATEDFNELMGYLCTGHAIAHNQTVYPDICNEAHDLYTS